MAWQEQRTTGATGTTDLQGLVIGAVELAREEPEDPDLVVRAEDCKLGAVAAHLRAMPSTDRWQRHMALIRQWR